MDALVSLQGVYGFFGLAFFYVLWLLRPVSKVKDPLAPPEPAGKLPIIGHLHLLGGSQPLIRTLGSLADKYGNAFTLCMGLQRAVVVSNWKLAKECLTTNDRVLATRPRSASAKYLGYNYAGFGFSPYGHYWREIRKIATLELLSSRQLELLKSVRAEEIDLSARDLYGQWVGNEKLPIKVEMKQWLRDLMFNNVVMAIVGKRCFGTNMSADGEEASKFCELIERFFSLSSIFVLSDAIPHLEWLDVGGHIKAMKETAEELDCLMSTWVEEHRRRRMISPTKKLEDFIDVMLSTLDNAQFSNYDPDTVIKATSLTLILAGTDTTFISVTWALSLLMNNPHILEKAQKELDGQIGKERNVVESDIKNLPYLQAIVKETLRLYPAAPLAVPHEATEDCKIGGYDVPSGTRVMLNLWKLQRDPTVWSDPHEFQPERFLTSHADFDVKGQHFQLIPFGSGRRMCPGMLFALHVTHLTLARLIHGFEIVTPGGDPVDMTEGPGVTLTKTSALEVLLSPRLAPHLYE